MQSEINDRYTCRIDREISKGGMGTVYEATQLGAHGFAKKVAIKTILPTLCKHHQFIDMFIGEGKLVADLVHENIVQIYQLGHAQGAYFIVMEYVNGLSLHDFIRFHVASSQPVPTELAVFITSRIARGLAYAHSRQDRKGMPLNIVHRDVCPNNIMITTEGLPKLGDFGIAKAANNIIPLQERSLVGKLYYMSPEQAQRQPVDFRSDIYSLGLVLFELLALEKARFRDGAEVIATAQEGWLNWELLPKTVNPDLRGIMRRMLALDQAERYDSTAKLAHDLEYFIYHKGYGPTVVSLEKYLRENFPFLYVIGNVPLKEQPDDSIQRTIPMDLSKREEAGNAIRQACGKATEGPAACPTATAITAATESDGGPASAETVLADTAVAPDAGQQKATGNKS
ncbi:MAG: hypothetical protein A3K19_31425 [Lentisphaerae bacterium RIFOXYB12_FULL_65_16]|nr:MAG: hypothetical protein A3K18_10150 [Lentisphaerae bacterium RIFOXYA12_64_32]OGV88557.1 MAG: hypothetical protein A3K19_31425 [Lentisphaerae bacterium RIFOXYB12_FULL_65_16]